MDADFWEKHNPRFVEAVRENPEDADAEKMDRLSEERTAAETSQARASSAHPHNTEGDAHDDIPSF